MYRRNVFEDKEGREIVITVEGTGEEVSARHDGQLVGQVMFYWNDHQPGVGDGMFTPELRMDDIHVESAYQRAGIGTKLIETAVAHHGEFAVPPPHQNPESRGDWYLTEDGHKLIYHCVEEGILPESCITSTESDSKRPPPDRYNN